MAETREITGDLVSLPTYLYSEPKKIKYLIRRIDSGFSLPAFFTFFLIFFFFFCNDQLQLLQLNDLMLYDETKQKSGTHMHDSNFTTATTTEFGKTQMFKAKKNEV